MQCCWRYRLDGLTICILVRLGIFPCTAGIYVLENGADCETAGNKNNNKYYSEVGQKQATGLLLQATELLLQATYFGCGLPYHCQLLV